MGPVVGLDGPFFSVKTGWMSGRFRFFGRPPGGSRVGPDYSGVERVDRGSVQIFRASTGWIAGRFRFFGRRPGGTRVGSDFSGADRVERGAGPIFRAPTGRSAGRVRFSGRRPRGSWMTGGGALSRKEGGVRGDLQGEDLLPGFLWWPPDHDGVLWISLHWIRANLQAQTQIDPRRRVGPSQKRAVPRQGDSIATFPYLGGAECAMPGHRKIRVWVRDERLRLHGGILFPKVTAGHDEPGQLFLWSDGRLVVRIHAHLKWTLRIRVARVSGSAPQKDTWPKTRSVPIRAA